jgi:hypothetical protein
MNGSSLPCLDPALEDHHIVSDDAQAHVAFAAGRRSHGQGVALISLHHRIASFDLPPVSSCLFVYLIRERLVRSTFAVSHCRAAAGRGGEEKREYWA